MSKKPNVLNNLLRRVREQKFPGGTIAHAAEKIGIPHTYLTKLENGDIEKPNEENFEKILEHYGRPTGLDGLFQVLMELAANGDLPGDDGPRTVVPCATRVAMIGLASKAYFGATYTIDTMKQLPIAASEYVISVEACGKYLMDTRNGDTLGDWIAMGAPISILEAGKADTVLQGHRFGVFVPGVLLGLSVQDDKLAITASEKVLGLTARKVNKVPGMIGYPRIRELINFYVGNMHKTPLIQTNSERISAAQSSNVGV
jgi:transcriptional regulator with XRE-family HTH domain